MERIIPDFNKIQFTEIFKRNDNDITRDLTEEEYVSFLENFERKVEKSLIETFKRVNIRASVKSDPYSLPYTDEVVVTLHGESYMNGVLEVYRVAGPIFKELLNKNIHELRFYMFINAEKNINNPFDLGRLVYKFRYYERK